MHMTFEQIPPPEHPAIYAAKTIRKMHEDTIEMMDNGFVYHDAAGANVNDQMRAACLHQIELCDAIIESQQEEINLMAAMLQQRE